MAASLADITMDYNSDSDNNRSFVGGIDTISFGIPFNYWDRLAEMEFDADLPRARANDPDVTKLCSGGYNDTINNLNSEQWEQIGRDLSNNMHLEQFQLRGVDEDGHKLTSLFRGLTKSTSISCLNIDNNGWSATGLRCMVPFLQNANNLETLVLSHNSIQSEGFNVVLRSLRDSPIEDLWCCHCGIDAGIDIDLNNFPKKLTGLSLIGNNISSDGCHEIAKILKRGDTVLTRLYLNGNEIGDEGVAILVDALQNNATLKRLEVNENGISQKGEVMLLKLVNDISSIEATLRSNHTLTWISVKEFSPWHIDIATDIDEANRGDADAAGIEKVIQTQLNSVVRAQFAQLQGVTHTLYSEINPLHLPEVLSLVSEHHGLGELYVALKLSILEVVSMMDTKQCVKHSLANDSAKSEEPSSEHEPQLAYCIGRSEEMKTKLTKTKAAEESVVETESDESRMSMSKRRRT